MLIIDHTCIKKGNYTIATEEKPEPTPVNPEIDTPDPDFDHEPSEIDYPDYGLCSESVFGANVRSQCSELDTQSHDHDIKIEDFNSIVREVRKDIAKNTFLEKCTHYMKLLRVDRQEFDDYLIYEFDVEELIFDMDVKVNEVRVFERLFSLYCQDNAFVIPAQHNQHLREYLDRLEPDGRYFPKKQLNLFGEV